MTALTVLLERQTIAPMDVAAARQVWNQWRAARGLWAYNVPLLTAPQDNVKLNKSAVPTYGVSLAPASLSGINTCMWSTKLCRKGCLNTSGKGMLDKVQRGRILKTQFLSEEPSAFVTLLEHEIRRAVRRHGAIMMRLNVLSDLRWERFAPHLFELEGVSFYDYTKSRARALEAATWSLDYRLVYSASERDDDASLKALRRAGVTTAVVYDRMPTRGVVNGDETDDRYHEAPGVLVALKAKGRMRDHATYRGFVRAA